MWIYQTLAKIFKYIKQWLNYLDIPNTGKIFKYIKHWLNFQLYQIMLNFQIYQTLAKLLDTSNTD